MLTRFVLCLCIWSAPPAYALAGVGSLDYTEIKESGVVVLATLADVKAVLVESKEPDTSHLDGSEFGMDLSRLLSKGDALSTIWSVYTDPTAPLEVTVNCDWELSRKFQGFNWTAFEPRYAVLNSAIRRHLESGRTTDDMYFDGSVTSAFSFANHAAANLELCRTFAQSPIEDYRTTGPHRVALVYQATARTAEQLELNAKMLRYLGASLDSKELSQSAGFAIEDIARMHVDLGELPDALLPLLYKCRPGFDMQLRALATETRARIDKAASQLPLAPEWRSFVGQSVFVYGRRGYRGRWAETWLNVLNRDLWIDGLHEWPTELNSAKRLLVTGKLIERNDIPVFRYTTDGKWGEGLPVPTGYDMKKASTRYLLQDAKWQVMD